MRLTIPAFDSALIAHSEGRLIAAATAYDAVVDESVSLPDLDRIFSTLMRAIVDKRLGKQAILPHGLGPDPWVNTYLGRAVDMVNAWVSDVNSPEDRIAFARVLISMASADPPGAKLGSSRWVLRSFFEGIWDGGFRAEAINLWSAGIFPYGRPEKFDRSFSFLLKDPWRGTQAWWILERSSEERALVIREFLAKNEGQVWLVGNVQDVGREQVLVRTSDDALYLVESAKEDLAPGLTVRFDLLQPAHAGAPGIGARATPVVVPELAAKFLASHPIAAGTKLRGGVTYIVEEEIGRGGVAVVYRVRTEDDLRPFAMKALSDHRFELNPTMRERFRREIELQRSLSHPNVLRIEEAIDFGDAIASIMEFAAGGSLHERLLSPSLKGQGVPIEEAFNWMYQIARGLAALHERGIVHRDLTPKNILFRDAWTLCISDFGVARRLDQETLTKPGDHAGSLIYISAQQREKPHDATTADDVYSMGQVFFHLLSGASPHGVHRRLKEVRPECPHWMGELVERMRADARDERPPDAQHVLRDLVNVGR